MQRSKKLLLLFILICFFSINALGGFFLFPKTALAQWVVTDPVTGAQTTIKNIWDVAKVFVVNAGSMALTNFVTFFAQKLAYDAAVYVASGGKGQGALFQQKSFGEYLGDTAASAASEAVVKLGDVWGVDICQPPNPNIQLKIVLGLAHQYNPPTPRCEMTKVLENWKTFAETATTEEFLKKLGPMFEKGENDLGIAFKASANVYNKTIEKQTGKLYDRLEGKGFNPLVEGISGKIKTPAETIKGIAQESLEEGKKAQEAKVNVSSRSIAEGAVSAFGLVAGTFINTLANKLLEKVFQKGLYGSIADLITTDSNVYNPESVAGGGRRAAESAYADLLTPNIKDSGAYDVLTEFSTCPPKYKKISNCVIDSQLAGAIRQAASGEPLTVAEALSKGYLNGDAPLISLYDEANNQDPYCFRKGYCYSNLVKLRNARMLPLGWEIAALKSSIDAPVKLGEVISKFNDCDSAGKVDSTHPWCRLIDPNWILKAPLTLCKAKVYGSSLQTSENNFREEVCVDTPSCIYEDNAGNCLGGWGNCVREKNIWRLNGDACLEQYDTCRAYKKRDNTTVSYLNSTLDYGPPCTSNDVGCRWYCGDYNAKSVPADWSCTKSSGKKVYLNQNAKSCTVQEDGCSEFIKTEKLGTLNLIQNPSFEDDKNSDKMPDIWTSEGISTSDFYSQDGTQSQNGQGAVKIYAPQSFKQTSIVKEKTDYTISLYFKTGQGAILPAFYVSCNKGTGTGIITSPDSSMTSFGSQMKASPKSLSSTYARLIGTFNTGNNNQCVLEIKGPYGGSSDDYHWFDSVQWEEGVKASSFHTEYGGTKENLYLKKAPSYYNCYNTLDGTPEGILKKDDDAPECANYAPACQADEVGCKSFTPFSGGAAITANVSYPTNYCPSECVGYNGYKKEAINFEEAEFPLYLIPSRNQSCAAQDMGCTEFTNLKTETLEYYKTGRLCQKPGSDSLVYYTWEGSDTTGYQLKVWNLKSDARGAPCTQLSEDVKSCTASVDCSKYFNKQWGDVDYDPLKTPDCREFYDEKGKVYYRFYSKTITSTNDCITYRKTYNSTDPRREKNDCQYGGGVWDIVGNACLYNFYTKESQVCPSSSKGCRMYTGSSARNFSQIFVDDFEAKEILGWQPVLSSTEAVQSGGHSAKISGGKSLETFYIDSSMPCSAEFCIGSSGKNTCQISKGQTSCGRMSSLVSAGKFYLLSFWAKTSSAAKVDLKSSDVKFTYSGATSDKELSFLSSGAAVSFNFNWNYYTLGPLYFSRPPQTDERLIITNPSSAILYLDNIELKEVTGHYYLIKDSGDIPLSCDTNSFGTYQPKAMLGCEGYKDLNGSSHYLTSFSKLCRSEAVGCEKVVDTYNSSSPFSEKFKNFDVPADSYLYLIIDKKNYCKQTDKGCQALGLPNLDSQGDITGSCALSSSCSLFAGCDCKRGSAVICKVAYGKTSCGGKGGWNTVYFKNNPDQYSGQGNILCEAKNDGCEEFTDSLGSKYYFRDPGKRVCEWKENVVISGVKKTGWFQQGTSSPCYSDYEKSGIYGIWKNKDKGYIQWTGLCPSTADLCAKFIDPYDVSKNYPQGKSYYFLKNNKLDVSSCKGQVSFKEGCVLLNDTSNPRLTINTGATYYQTESKQSSFVSPEKTDAKTCTLDKNYTGGAIKVDTKNNVSCNEEDGCFCRDTTNQVLCVVPKGSGSCTADKDANFILKVKQDRVCGEWLACKSSTSTWDASSGKYKELCDEVGLCNKFQQFGESTQCVSWLGSDQRKDEILTEEKYTSRDVTWRGMDYAGYSLFNKFPVQFLRQINVAPEYPIKHCSDDVLKICTDDKQCSSGVCTTQTDLRLAYISTDEKVCKDTAGKALVNGTVCLGAGACFNGRCAFRIEGDKQGKPQSLIYTMTLKNPLTGDPLLSSSVYQESQQSCRAYPESDSPFPNTVADASNFSRANVCQKKYIDNGAEKDISSSGCECSYQKVDYSGAGVMRYYPVDLPESSVPDGICKNGPYDGKTCNPSVSSKDVWKQDGSGGCAPGGTATNPSQEGTCMPKSNKKAKVYGWPGYCLEEDKSTNINNDKTKFACLSWLPVDQLPGSMDLYNQYKEAGFALHDSYYCLQPELYKDIKSNYQSPDMPGDAARAPPLAYCGLVTVPLFVIGAGCFYDNYQNVARTYIKNTDQLRCGKGYFMLLWNGDGCDGSGNLKYACVPKGSVHNIGKNLQDNWSKNITWDAEVKKGDYCEPPSQKYLDTSFNKDKLAEWICKEDDYNILNNLLGCSGSCNDFSSEKIDVANMAEEIYRVNSQVTEAHQFWNGYQDCIRYGVPYNEAITKTIDTSTDPIDRKPSWYLGCKSVVQVAKSEQLDKDANKAWTNRVAWDKSGYAVADQNEFMRYIYNSPRSSFGKSDDPSKITNPLDAAGPIKVPLCRVKKDGTFDLPNAVPSTSKTIECPLPLDPTKKTDDIYDKPYFSDPLKDKMARPYMMIKTKIGTTTAFEPDSVTESNIDTGVNRIQGLFAKIYNVYNWTWTEKFDPSAYASVLGQYKSDSNFEKDISGDAKYAVFAPQVASMGSCQGNTCSEGPLGLTVNNVNSGTVEGKGGHKRVSLKFFAWADDDHMPIRDIRVAWGDEKITSSTIRNNKGFYKNRRGQNQCNNSSFGRSKAACEESYLYFSHDYTCPKDGMVNGKQLLICRGGVNTFFTETLGGCWDDIKNACRFKPRVQVLDNWDWCNGVCGDASDTNGGVGCYDNKQGGGQLECAFEDYYPNKNNKIYNHPWTYFSGDIMIKP